MQGITRCPEEILYREFGVNAELIIDHAWGRESCTMEDIKNYKSKSRSVSNSQILFKDYSYDQARIVIEEMIRSGCFEMMRRKVITNKVSITVGYSKEVHSPTGGRMKMRETTNLPKIIVPYALQLYEKTTARNMPIRRLGIGFEDVCDEGCEGYDLFTNWEEVKREKKLARATLELQTKFGKNAIIMASDLQEGATLIERNKLIGGHNADD